MGGNHRSEARAGVFDPAELSRLGELIDPDKFTGAVDCAEISKEQAIKYLEDMLLIRLAEEAIAELVLDGSAKCPCHLGIGQEAVAVGVSASLRATDRVFGAHRSHSHYLALGADVKELMAEVLGKDTGCSRGMGGSMHLQSRAHGFYGSVPIVGATIPIAVGAALAAKLDGGSDIAVCYFGDGACEEGVFHESLNLAAVHKLPVLFVVENNLYSSHLDIALRQPTDMVARFAVAHTIPARVIDGNDIRAVRSSTAELCGPLRAHKGPALLEAITYRWRGHVGPDENIDVGLRRKREDLERWKQRDPIRRLADAMSARQWISEKGYGDIVSRVRAKVGAAVDCARKAPYPPPQALLDRVFVGGRDNQ